MSKTEQIGKQARQVIAAPLPEVGACYGHAWKYLWKNFPMLLLIFVIYAGMSIPNFIPSLGYFYAILVGWPLVYGWMFVTLKIARGEEIKVGEFFYGFKNCGNVFLAMMLVALITIGGLILGIVPGVIFACKLAFVPYLVMDKKMEAIESISQSWRMTSGYAWKVFLTYLLAIPIVIAGIICLCVGVIPASMWMGIALASLYYAVSTASSKTKTTV